MNESMNNDNKNHEYFLLVNKNDDSLCLLVNDKTLLFKEAVNAENVLKKLIDTEPQVGNAAIIKHQIVYSDKKIIYEDDVETAEKEIFGED